MEVKGQLLRVGSLLPPVGSRLLTRHQSGGQASVPTEPPYWLQCRLLSMCPVPPSYILSPVL